MSILQENICPAHPVDHSGPECIQTLSVYNTSIFHSIIMGNKIRRIPERIRLKLFYML